jgi:hypothetical protein
VGPVAPRYRNVARLTPFPSKADPVLVFLGVKSDRKTAVFLVSSLAAPAGQGTCSPSARQCEFLDLKAGQRELLLVRNADGGLTEYKLGINAVRLAQTASAAKAKLSYARESRAGAKIIREASPSSLALQSLSYSMNTGTVSFHRVSHATLQRLRKAGAVTTGVVLHPVRRS